MNTSNDARLIIVVIFESVDFIRHERFGHFLVQNGGQIGTFDDGFGDASVIEHGFE